MSGRTYVAAALAATAAAAMALCGCSDKGKRPAAVCGNLELEPGEDCDSADIVLGNFGCSAGMTCGDGVQDPQEECDDGNTESGDGCSAHCLLEGTCWDGRLDHHEACDPSDPDNRVDCDDQCELVRACGDGFVDPDEECDDGNNESGDGCDDQCGMENPVAECGNLVPETGEECDDGNNVLYDGCHRCRKLQTLFVTNLGFLPASIGWDFKGSGGHMGEWDCRVDNRVGEIEEYRNALCIGIDYALHSNFVLLFTFDRLEDPLALNDDDIVAYMFNGEDNDNNPDTNFLGGETFFVRDDDLTPEGMPATVCTGSIRDGRMDIVVDDCSMNIRMENIRIPFRLSHLRFEGPLTYNGRGIRGISGGRGAGVFSARSMVEYPELFIEYVALLVNLTPATYPTFLDLMVLGVLENISDEPFQPDTDIDGDGLERFYDTQPDDGISSIDLCVDGDGTEIRGENCALDPRIQDGYSVTLYFDAIWAELGGLWQP